jgi:hypothetical protein
MATLAEVLRQAGYVTPQGQVVGPRTTTAQTMSNYIRNIIPNAAQNLAQQRSDIDAALTMGDQGIQVGDRAAFERQIEQVPNLGGVMKVSGAMRTAQKNAALPIEQGGLGLPPNNTAMDRAKAMGFDTQVFHGTAEDFSKLDPSKYGSTTGAKTGEAAFWVTDSPEVARTYAEYAAKDAKVKKLLTDAEYAQGRKDWDFADDLIMQAEQLEREIAEQPLRGQYMMPFLLRSQKLGTKEMGGRSFNDFGVSDEILERIIGAKKYDKLGGVAFSNLDDAVGRVNLPATHYAVVDPTIIRSKFAAFDPKKINKPDLMASSLALPLADEDTRRSILEKLFEEKQK